jgi:hypothetical protein
MTTAHKLTLSDQRLPECAIKPLPSPSIKSINIVKPRSALNLSMDQVSQDNASSRTAKAREVTPKTDRGLPKRSPQVHNRLNKLSVIDEIDELFQQHRRSIRPRR